MNLTAPLFPGVGAPFLQGRCQVKTSAYAVQPSDYGSVIDCDTTNGAFTVSLPSAAQVGPGFLVTIRLVTLENGTTPALLTIQCNQADGVNGMNALVNTASTLFLCRPGECITLQSTGASGYSTSQGWCTPSYFGVPMTENAVYNPQAVVAQRPANATGPATGVFVIGTVDRFDVSLTGTTPLISVTQGSAIGSAQTSLRIDASLASSTGVLTIRQAIEAKDAQAYAGLVCVFSALVKTNMVGCTVALNIYPMTSADSAVLKGTTGSGLNSALSGGNLGVAQAASGLAISSGPVQITTACANGFVIEIKTSSSVGTISKSFQATNITLQPGTVALLPRQRTYQEELARCQRYFYNPIDTTVTNSYLCTGQVYSTASGNVLGTITFPVQMRIAPAAPAITGTAFYALNSTGTGIAFTSATIDGISSKTCRFNGVGAINVGIVQGDAALIVSITSGSTAAINLDADF